MDTCDEFHLESARRVTAQLMKDIAGLQQSRSDLKAAATAAIGREGPCRAREPELRPHGQGGVSAASEIGEGVGVRPNASQDAGTLGCDCQFGLPYHVFWQAGLAIEAGRMKSARSGVGKTFLAVEEALEPHSALVMGQTAAVPQQTTQEVFRGRRSNLTRPSVEARRGADRFA